MARSPSASDNGKEPTAEDLSRQIEELKADLAGITETLAGIAKARGQAAGDAAYAEASRLYKQGEKTIHHLQSQAGEFSDQAEEMVRKQPAIAMGIAAGIGFLIGLIMSRK